MEQREILRTKILDALIIKKLPDDVCISTMTICCELEIQFNVDNIAKYIELKKGDITSISYGRDGDPLTNRSLFPKKKKNKIKKTIIKKKQKREFHNQISLNVMVVSKKDKPVNIKLFTNGSIQMTGCKSVENVIDVLAKIFDELKTIRAIIDTKTFTIVDKPFVNNFDVLDIRHVNNITIGMINSNFKYENKIDRLKLFNLLNSESKECRYDPSNHAPVNIKFNCKDKSISIFVFEKGSILITGAKNCSHILEGYEFINKYLLTNHKKIVKSSINISNINNYLTSTKNMNNFDNEYNFDNLEDIEDLEDLEDTNNFKLVKKNKTKTIQKNNNNNNFDSDEEIDKAIKLLI